MRRTWAATRVSIAVIAASAMAGCATPGGPGSPSSAELSCLGTPIPVEAFVEPRPATDLSENGQAALQGAEVPPIDDLADWTVVRETEDEVVLLRELPEPQMLGAGDVRTHEYLSIAVVEAPNLPDSPGWMLRGAGSCALERDLGDLGSATVTLDPDRPPDPASTELALLVTERACNSGRDAAGRVELVELTETDTTVAVVIGVEPRTGAATCQSNPPTPFVVELDEPSGDRMLLDASTVPARELAE